MTDNDLFSSSDDQSPPPPAEDTDHDFLADLVGEGKKFKDPQALARSVLHKEMHIREIEKENAELRQLAKQGLTREEFLEAIKDLKQNSPSNPPKVDQEEPTQTLEQVTSLVDQRVQQHLTAETQRSNLKLVGEAAQKALGPGYQKILKDRANALGESIEDLTKLAATKPKVFLELMIPKSSDTHVPSLPRTEVDSGKSGGTSSQVRNQSYYQKLRKDNPKAFESRQVQIQMHNDALALREKFFDS